jgi:hypothetical protein
MKMKLVLAGLLILLLNTGSSCINDSILVAVNLPISSQWAINGGSNPNFSGRDTVVLADQIDDSYHNKIQNARYYDIRVSVIGTYSGNVSGTASIGLTPTNLVPLLTFTGSWADFQTPQSLLGSSSHITPQPAGIAVLVSALNSFTTNNNTTVYLLASGALSQAPVPNGLSVKIEILSQVDAQVGSGDSSN